MQINSVCPLLSFHSFPSLRETTPSLIQLISHLAHKALDLLRYLFFHLPCSLAARIKRTPFLCCSPALPSDMEQTVELSTNRMQIKEPAGQMQIIKPSFSEELNKLINDQKKKIEKAQKIIEENHRQLKELSEKISPETSMNHIAMQLMMDKLFIPERKYEGSLGIITTKKFLDAFEKLDDHQANWMLTEDFRQILSHLRIRFTPLLQNFIELHRMRFSINMKPLFEKAIPEVSYTNHILEMLANLQVKESLLIPLGCVGHLTSLLVQRISPEKFRLIHYNTGLGLHWHCQLENFSHRYQTYIVIDEVPAASLLNKNHWETKDIVLGKAENIDFVYNWIYDAIGQGGILLPPSENEEDYDAAQNAGTCTMQNLMAFFRHQIMQMDSTSLSLTEKWALYKILKVHLFLQYLKDNQPQLDEHIQACLPSIVAKLEAERVLMQIAKEPTEFQAALDHFKCLLDRLEQEAFVFSCGSSDLINYAHLRHLSLALFRFFISHPDALQPDMLAHPAFHLVSTKLAHYKTIRQNISARLAKHFQENNFSAFINEVIFILNNTPHRDFALKEATKYLGLLDFPTPSPTPHPLTLFLEKLHVKHEDNEALVRAFIQELKNQGAEARADWVSRRWEQLSAS
ncbi:hypothetical protein [Candidatus Protochlamydia phocaeensis]|uniref:hypothetical protein n=1 Tax=Candidatus Protochlamydia phocaeensis TaxID=1414722 RepID=UPI000839A26F|nr:hypothetical protein [Candidatus Protochlamydia phocaeensis]